MAYKRGLKRELFTKVGTKLWELTRVGETLRNYQQRAAVITQCLKGQENQLLPEWVTYESGRINSLTSVPTSGSVFQWANLIGSQRAGKALLIRGQSLRAQGRLQRGRDGF